MQPPENVTLKLEDINPDMIIDYSEEYKDIINMERPVHKGDEFEARHPHMSQENRAKIFAPFAALKGYEEAIDNASESVNNSDS